MTRLAFIDTETTSLRPDRRAWEIGLIVRDENGAEEEHHWFVDTTDLDLGNADLMSLKIGRFHERHPGKWAASPCGPEFWVMEQVEALTRGTHLVGAVVSFDADVLGQRMRAHGICPSFHYHLIDIEALAVGYLSAIHRLHAWPPGIRDDCGLDRLPSLIAPPWKSDDLSAALGISISDEDRHTALGDARWAKAIYDAVMGSAR